MSDEFTHLFDQKRQFTHFKQLMTGYVAAEKKTIAHMNGLFTIHSNQSNLNRFITDAHWDKYKMNAVKINIINQVEPEDNVLVLDDVIVEKYGSKIYGVDYHFDHSLGRTVKGWQIADCVLSGKGIYPLLSSLYLRKNSRWLKQNEFKSKIEIQKDHLSQVSEMGLHFSCVVMDIWYFSKTLTDHIESLGKDWIAQSKSNRLVRSNGKWISLKRFGWKKLNRGGFKIAILGDQKYLMKVFTVTMKKAGRVRLLVSMNKHGNINFYVSNNLEWDELAIATRYSRRWDIEVWHREGKGDFGLKDCRLRCDEGVSRYLTLSTLADTLLEIASLLSPVYAMLKNRVIHLR
ncbi:MAG: transposase [Candidatus Thermoplasmatota archaeon]|nr:transposase [Candidatus Thermoplasmatota archaeon]